MNGRYGLVGMAAALTLGLVLRLPVLGAEFWLDEILSLQKARQAGSPLGVLTVRHDNNHHLNTAWLALWPDASPWVCYRLHAVVAGLATVVVAAWVARRWGGPEAVFAAVLFAGSYWLVLASGEARGYALAVPLALAAFAALRGYLDERGWPWLGGFWLACLLAFLAHLSFVQAYLGLVVWSLRRFARQRRGPCDELRRLAGCHAGIAVFFALFYLFCIRGMEIAGAPPAPLLPVVERLVVLGLGGPANSPWGLAWVAAFFALGVVGLRLLYRQGDDSWVFFAVCVFAAPALFLARRPPFLFERYFLVPFAFFLLLAALVLASGWRRGGLGRAAAVAALLLVLAGNAWHVARFVRGGRGQFAEALQWVLRADPADRVTVSGDHDFRVGAYVAFYAGYHAPRQVVYTSGADWLFVHRLDDRWPPQPQLRDAGGNVYALARQWPARGPGAWGWFVYRRVRP